MYSEGRLGNRKELITDAPTTLCCTKEARHKRDYVFCYYLYTKFKNGPNEPVVMAIRTLPRRQGRGRRELSGYNNAPPCTGWWPHSVHIIADGLWSPRSTSCPITTPSTEHGFANLPPSVPETPMTLCYRVQG